MDNDGIKCIHVFLVFMVGLSMLTVKSYQCFLVWLSMFYGTSGRVIPVYVHVFWYIW